MSQKRIDTVKVLRVFNNEDLIVNGETKYGQQRIKEKDKQNNDRTE